MDHHLRRVSEVEHQGSPDADESCASYIASILLIGTDDGKAGFYAGLAVNAWQGFDNSTLTVLRVAGQKVRCAENPTYRGPGCCEMSADVFSQLCRRLRDAARKLRQADKAIAKESKLLPASAHCWWEMHASTARRTPLPQPLDCNLERARSILAVSVSAQQQQQRTAVRSSSR